MKKILKSCFICLIIIAVLGTTAFAAQPVDPQSNSYIAKTTISPVAMGNGVIEFDCGITATDTMDKLGIMQIDIYKQGRIFMEGHSYTDPGYEDLMGYGKSNHNTGVSFQGEVGETYYAVVGFYAKKGNGAGGYQMESFLITAK